MKKIGRVLIIFCFLLSCSNKRDSVHTNWEQVEGVYRPKLVLFLGDFINRHPNWDNNSITMQKTNELLRNEFEEKLNEGLLDSLPITFIKINEYKKSIYAAQFVYKNSEYKIDNETYFDVEFNVIGLVSGSLIDKLANANDSYYLNGKFIKFLERDYGKDINENVSKYYINEDTYPYAVELSKENNYIKTDLGTLLFDITDAMLIRK